MKTIQLGSLQAKVSAVGLGGEGVLRTYGREVEARAVLDEALRSGITYYDSARAYSDSEVYIGQGWGRNQAQRKAVFQTSKSASRDKESALLDLTSTLQRLKTDYLDLWQIHDVRTEEDLEAITRPGGALEAFLEAKERGLVRYIGVTGHHDPFILTMAVEQWPVDTVLMPVNPVEEILGGFMTHTLPAARKRGVAVIGMKVLGASHYILPKLDVTPELLIRYALSCGIDLPIVGCATPEEVRTLSGAANLPPLEADEKKNLIELFRPYASRLAFYRGIR